MSQIEVPLEQNLQNNDANRYSKAISGAWLVQSGSQGQNSVAMAQVIGTAENQQYDVDLEAGVVQKSGKVHFARLLRFRQSDAGRPETFELTLEAKYRFKVTSGTNNTDILVLLGT